MARHWAIPMSTAWRCRPCCRERGKSYRYPPSPDVYCLDCGAALSQREREIEVLRLLLARQETGLPISVGLSAHKGAGELATPEPKLTYTVEEAAERLRCKRTRVYELLKEGRLQRASSKTGRRTLLVAACLIASSKHQLGKIALGTGPTDHDQISHGGSTNVSHGDCQLPVE